MYIVNTSFMVDYGEEAPWRELIIESYIPMLREEGFGDIVFTKVLTDQSPGTYTYSLQVRVRDIAEYQRLTDDLFGRYRLRADKIFDHKVHYFISLLKHVDF